MADIQAALAILRDLQRLSRRECQPGEESDAALRALADHDADTGQTALAITTCKDLLKKVQASKINFACEIFLSISLH